MRYPLSCYLNLCWILVFLSACSPRDESLVHSFRIYERDRVTITVTSGGPKYEGELFEYEEVLRMLP